MVRSKRVIAVSVATLLVSLTFTCLVAADQVVNAQAVYNGQDGLWPSLKLESVTGRQINVPANTLIASNNVLFVTEEWYTGKPPQPRPAAWIGRAVEIRRWEFQQQLDAEKWAHLPASSLWGASGFPGWQTTPEVGSHTCWKGDKSVVFVKGKFLVRLYVNSKQVDRNYTLAVAKDLANKL